jgi:UDP-GlcNAc:undecaprenyl-phosphate GlcNAc-1-phosphate transferase
MVACVFAAITAFIIALIILPLVITFSKRKKLFDIPGGRRIHKKITPSLGGVAIFVGFLLSSFIWTSPAERMHTIILFTVLVIPFTIGLFDDLFHLKPSLKLLAQALAGSAIIFILDIKLTSFYGLFTTPDFLEIISYSITLLTIIMITNSFNLIDGLDGLAGTFSLVSLLFFGFWFYQSEDFHYAILSFALSGSIIAFLLLNWEPSKIFMGDTGSLVIGMMLSVFVIEFINHNYQLPVTSAIKFNSSVGTAICILIIPLTDTIRVVILRLSKKVSPFTPDKRHIHHVLVRVGLSHRLAVAILCAIHLIFLSTAVLLHKMDDLYIILFTTVTAIILCVSLDRLLARQVNTNT